MKIPLLNSGKLPPLLFGVLAFVYFGWIYPHHLHHHEQMQLFLFTGSYFWETVWFPGGLAEYVSRFLVQFFYYAWTGALIVAGMLLLLQRAMRAMLRSFGENSLAEPLTFVPSLFFWYLAGDEHVLPAGLVAALFVLGAFWGWSRIASLRWRRAAALLGLPLLYAAAGGVFLLFVLFSCVFERMRKSSSSRSWLLFSAFLVAAACSLPFCARAAGWQYPLSLLWMGARFYRYPELFIPQIVGFWSLLAVVPLSGRWLPAGNPARPSYRRWKIAGWSLLALTGLVGLSRSTDWENEERMAYDYAVRAQQWSVVIRHADRKSPRLPLTVAALNLALGKTGQLPDRMFRYFQNGAEGLLPAFMRDFASATMTGEIYYHLGFVQTAQRLAFEAMESLPDYQKSARSVKRLAETHLILGDYAVSAKYLRWLQQTLFYRKWATETLVCLGDETKIESRAEWRNQRRRLAGRDVLFSEEKNLPLRAMLAGDTSNRLAFEYLMAYYLLERDLSGFCRDFRLSRKIGYDPLPRSYQEVWAFMWIADRNGAQRPAYPVSDRIMQQAQAFGSTYTKVRNAQPLLQKQYADTYWYYLTYP